MKLPYTLTLLLIILNSLVFGQKVKPQEKMKIEIWSDVVCPFCYIGKRHLETALNQLNLTQEVEIIWKSYQLDPNTPNNLNENVYAYLAKAKGITYEQSVQMHARVVEMAKQAGLNYNFDIAKVANSFNAHCLIQAAKMVNKGNEIKEAIFDAYFTKGADINDMAALQNIGRDAGLPEDVIEIAFSEERVAEKVKNDILEARQIGVSGVPFFVLDRKYAISGAQPIDVFVESIQKAYTEWKAAQ